MTQALDGLARFLGDAVCEAAMSGIQTTREAEVLKDQQALFIAQVVKVIGLIDAAAPDPQHRHVGRDGDIQQRRHLLATDARQRQLGGNPVGTAAEDGPVVDDKVEALALAVVDEVLLKLDAAGTDAQGLLLDDVVAMAYG